MLVPNNDQPRKALSKLKVRTFIDKRFLISDLSTTDKQINNKSFKI